MCTYVSMPLIRTQGKERSDPNASKQIFAATGHKYYTCILNSCPVAETWCVLNVSVLLSIHSPTICPTSTPSLPSSVPASFFLSRCKHDEIRRFRSREIRFGPNAALHPHCKCVCSCQCYQPEIFASDLKQVVA